MTRYTVDSDAVAQATGQTQAAIGRIQTDVTGLTSHLVGLQNSWSGGASAAFQTAFSDWRTVQRQVEESLTALAGALGIAGRVYSDTEDQNSRLFLR